MSLENFAERIWTSTTHLKLFGVELGARMTVVDLDGRGTLFVHSPIQLTPDLKSHIDRIGTVAYVVAPNRWHHLFVNDFKKMYPTAQYYGAPGLEKKRKDLQFDRILSEEQNFPWNPHLEHKRIEGVPIFNETVFFHPLSKTLIVTDLALHICKSPSLLTRVVFRMLGTYGQFGWAKLEKALYVRDRRAFRESVSRLLDWDIEKILLAHGEPLQSDGKGRLIAAFLDK